MANQNNSSKKGFFLTRWVKRFFFGAGKELEEMNELLSRLLKPPRENP